MMHNLTNSKHKKKHKKEKSKHKKKDKKSKNKKNKLKKKYLTDSSSSSASSLSDTEQKGSSETFFKHEDFNFLENALSQTSSDQEKKTVETKKHNIYDPKSNPKELNPYWQENGSGLPSNSLGTNSKIMFLKPGDKIPDDSKIIRKHQSNWRKKEGTLQKNPNSVTDNCKNETAVKNDNWNIPKTTTNDKLNSLAAKILKAEILGNTREVERLKAELKAAEEAKEVPIAPDNSQVNIRKRMTEICSRKDLEYKRKHAEALPSKRMKLNDQEKFLYDNSKYDLQNMFLRAKKKINNESLESESNVKYINEFDDDCLEATSSEKSIKSKRKQRRKILHDIIKEHKSFEGCSWCLNNNSNKKHLIASIGTKCYLCLPEVKSLTEWHCFIVPIEHEVSAIKLGEDIWDEIKMYQKLLTKMLSDKGLDAVFFENARSFRHYPHCYIQCISLDKELGAMAPIYFQKGISDSETEWSNNKKVIDYRNKDLVKVIPKDLPYFAVSFGIEGGFAHIIEDEQLFPRNFAEEIIGGMLDLEAERWRKPRKENFNAQREKVLEFLKVWKKYEFNENCQATSSSSESSDLE